MATPSFLYDMDDNALFSSPYHTHELSDFPVFIGFLEDFDLNHVLISFLRSVRETYKKASKTRYSRQNPRTLLST